MGFSSTLALGQEEEEMIQGKQKLVKFNKQEQQEKEQGDCKTTEMTVTPLDSFSPLLHTTQKEEQEKGERENGKSSDLVEILLEPLSPLHQMKQDIKKKKQVINLVTFYQQYKRSQGAAVSRHS